MCQWWRRGGTDIISRSDPWPTMMFLVTSACTYDVLVRLLIEALTGKYNVDAWQLRDTVLYFSHVQYDKRMHHVCGNTVLLLRRRRWQTPLGHDIRGGAVRGNTYAGGERYSIQNLVCIYCLDNINIYKAS